jgi:hypothetical protein
MTKSSKKNSTVLDQKEKDDGARACRDVQKQHGCSIRAQRGQRGSSGVS